MVYPWSKKKEEESSDIKEETSDVKEVDDKQNGEEDIIEDSTENEPTEEETIDTEVWDSEDPRAIMLNILKLEGYKMDSGELFIAFKGASKNSEEETIMADFSSALEQLSGLGKIRSDSDGNIMTVEDYDREKSQSASDEDTEEQSSANEDSSDEEKEDSPKENIVIETSKEEESDGDDLESIIKLKEETDSWLIEKLKDNNTSEGNEELRKEVEELKARVEKLEKIIVNLTNAFT